MAKISQVTCYPVSVPSAMHQPALDEELAVTPVLACVSNVSDVSACQTRSAVSSEIVVLGFT